MNRGVEKRDIFLDESDYSYFVHDLFVLNDINRISNNPRAFNTQMIEDEMIEDGPISSSASRERLVDIFIFTLMPNHFHLLLRQLVDGGITQFLRKLCTSHVMRFNKKYGRVGPLLQGRFKSVLVEEEGHFTYLPHYIHTNPLPLFYATKGDDIGPSSITWEEELAFLEHEYRWNSFPDYVGTKNFPSVTQRNFLLDKVGGEQAYREQTKEWLQGNKEKQLHSLHAGGVLLDFE